MYNCRRRCVEVRGRLGIVAVIQIFASLYIVELPAGLTRLLHHLMCGTRSVSHLNGIVRQVSLHHVETLCLAINERSLEVTRLILCTNVEGIVLNMVFQEVDNSHRVIYSLHFVTSLMGGFNLFPSWQLAIVLQLLDGIVAGDINGLVIGVEQ